MATLTDKGEIAIGVAIPTHLTLAGAAAAALPALLADLQATLAAAASLTAKLGVMPPSIAANLKAAVAMVAAIATSADIAPPGANFSGAYAPTLAAKLAVVINLLDKALAESAKITGLDEQAGVNAVVFEGTAAQLGREVAASVAELGVRPAARIYTPIFVATAQVGKTALQESLAVEPRKGRITVGAVVPLLLTASLQLRAFIRPIRAELSARYNGWKRISVRVVPPKITGTLEVAKKIKAACQKAVGLNLPVTFATSSTSALVARVNARIGRITTLLQLVSKLQKTSAGAGVRLWIYDGTLADFASTIDGAGGIPAAIGHDVQVFAPTYSVDASNAAALSAMKKLLGG